MWASQVCGEVLQCSLFSTSNLHKRALCMSQTQMLLQPKWQNPPKNSKIEQKGVRKQRSKYIYRTSLKKENNNPLVNLEIFCILYNVLTIKYLFIYSIENTCTCNTWVHVDTEFLFEWWTWYSHNWAQQTSEKKSEDPPNVVQRSDKHSEHFYENWWRFPKIDITKDFLGRSDDVSIIEQKI